MRVVTGKHAQTNEVMSGSSYVSQNDLRLHFGLGKLTRAEKIVIHWPSGLVETLTDLAANKYYVVREGAGVDRTQTREANKPLIPASPENR